MWAKQRGFTIVELLIVIVVIAILAAISIVAFTGVQNRAENSKTLAAVQSYVKALQQYHVDKVIILIHEHASAHNTRQAVAGPIVMRR